MRETTTPFGSRLRELRLEAGLTQGELGQKADMRTVSVSRLEIGKRKPRWETIQRLAVALGVDSAALLETANDFGGRLRRLRLDAGLTRAELAEIAGLSKGCVMNAENGKQSPRGRTVRRLALALGVDHADLMEAASDLGDTFGERLRWLRLSASLSLDELAQRAGLTRAALSALEIGKHRPLRETVQRLALALGVDYAAFADASITLTERLPVPVRQANRGAA
jgi:transcriptional regulator with XRE-family HTH domain